MNKIPTKRRIGFTLPEVMIALGIAVLIGALTLQTFIAILGVYYRSDIKNTVSGDYRTLSKVLNDKGNLANQFFLYPAFNNASHAVAPSINYPYSGDYVVFVYYSVQDIKTSPDMQGVSRIVGIYRENPGTGLSNIRWFDSTKDNWGQSFSPTSPVALTGTTTLESLLPDQSYYNKFSILAQHAIGTVSDTSANDYLGLFYAPSAGSINMSGLIIRATTNTGAGLSNYQSQTAFNLTISPRTN